MLAFLKHIVQPDVSALSGRGGSSAPPKPLVVCTDPRTLLISYASEQTNAPPPIGNHSTEKWANEFARQLKHLKISVKLTDVNPDHQRTMFPVDDRDTRSPSDFLVIFTIDYSERLSACRLSEHIEEKYIAGVLMWVLKLSPADFRVCDIGRHPWWHELKCLESHGQFKKLNDPDYEVEQVKAATIIYEHPSCKLPSPFCPAHQ